MPLDRDTLYKATLARDKRFDGRFYIGVRTTGIYCRPVCPARPLLKNVTFYRSQAEAEGAGFRPCLRCRPDISPYSPQFDGTGAVVARALRLIQEGQADSISLEKFADKLGITGRHLRRLFAEHLGASPIEVATSKRLHLARHLLSDSTLPVTEVAFASGFKSIRRFNQAFRDRYKKAPREFRKTETSLASKGISLRLPVLEPYDWDGIFKFLEKHAVPGVETFEHGRYSRAISGATRVSVSRGRGCLEISIENCPVGSIREVLARVRHLFDIDHNPAHLPHELKGLRVPGAYCALETAVGVILGQLVSTEGARNTMGKVVRHFGGVFPTAELLSRADLAHLGITKVKAGAIRELALLVHSGKLDLSRSAPLAETRARLRAIHGIGSWTEEVIALRCLGDPDAFPESDLFLARALQSDSSLQPVAWSPWRGYLALWIWKNSANILGEKNHALSNLEKPCGSPTLRSERKRTLRNRVRRQLGKSEASATSVRKGRKQSDQTNHR